MFLFSLIELSGGAIAGIVIAMLLLVIIGVVIVVVIIFIWKSTTYYSHNLPPPSRKGSVRLTESQRVRTTGTSVHGHVCIVYVTVY